MAATVRGVPEGVQPPVVTAFSSSSLHVSWSEPTHSRGIIQQYQLNQTGVGTIFTHNDGPRNYTVTGKRVRLLNASGFLHSHRWSPLSCFTSSSHAVAFSLAFPLSLLFSSFFLCTPLPSLSKYSSLDFLPSLFENQSNNVLISLKHINTRAQKHMNRFQNNLKHMKLKHI